MADPCDGPYSGQHTRGCSVMRVRLVVAAGRPSCVLRLHDRNSAAFVVSSAVWRDGRHGGFDKGLSMLPELSIQPRILTPEDLTRFHGCSFTETSLYALSMMLCRVCTP